MNFYFHNDPDLFRSSVEFTAKQTKFTANLIEKDYLCSVILNYLSQLSEGSLIFKGGTCLAKVYWGFNRLSEDLDFIIPMPVDAKRKERSKRVMPYKKAISYIPSVHPIFKLPEPLEGRNESRQYLATISYGSSISEQEETIKLEIGLREPMIIDSLNGEAETLLQNAANPSEKMQAFTVKCLSFEEAMAEKFRAALTRKGVAIRDFYDIDFAVYNKGLKTEDKNFIEMVRKKIAIPENDPPDMSDERLAGLFDQVEARLKPILRPKDFEAFDLERAIKHVTRMNSLL